jgi:hypothetical protein
VHRNAIVAQGSLTRIHRMTFGLLRGPAETDAPMFLPEEDAA